jgi:hypothetical protein
MLASPLRPWPSAPHRDAYSISRHGWLRSQDVRCMFGPRFQARPIRYHLVDHDRAHSTESDTRQMSRLTIEVTLATISRSCL